MKSITFQAVSQVSTAMQARLGERAETPDGRQWVYVKASSALAKGSVAVPAAVASADTVSCSTDSQGRYVYITKASAGWTVGAYADGWVVVDDGTGVGQAGRIKSNTADTLELYPEFALATALAVADSDITIWTQYLVRKAVVTTKVQNASGIAQVAFTANDYGWLLTKGIGTVLAGEALVVGTGFVTGDDTTGQVVKATTAKGTYDEQALGVAIVANASADQNALVYVSV